MIRLAVLMLFSSLIVVVQPEQRLTKRILFVVDTSGSMRGDRFQHACQAVLEIASQPVDEVEIGLLAFNAETRRWAGVSESGPQPVPAGWAGLPSAEAIQEAHVWLRESGAGGDTRVIPALREALREDRRELSLVIVSDGVFQRECTEDLLRVVAEGQAWRVERGLGEAVILSYGVGLESGALRQLGQAGGGGYFREKLSNPVLGAWR